jgi:hypothetical protein
LVWGRLPGAWGAVEWRAGERLGLAKTKLPAAGNTHAGGGGGARLPAAGLNQLWVEQVVELLAKGGWDEL